MKISVWNQQQMEPGCRLYHLHTARIQGKKKTTNVSPYFLYLEREKGSILPPEYSV